jgi:hypothetical protein
MDTALSWGSLFIGRIANGTQETHNCQQFTDAETDVQLVGLHGLNAAREG